MNHVPHIPVVDDDSEIRQMLADYLQRNGMRVSRPTVAGPCGR